MRSRWRPHAYQSLADHASPHTSPFAIGGGDLIGGLWAVIATIFVYREEHRGSVSAALTRASTTTLSFALCLIYLLFSFHRLGLAAVVGAETFLLMATGRDRNIGACNITTTVVMIAGALSPHAAWQEPILRLVDTAIGIIIGVGASSMAFHITALRAHHRCRRAPVRRSA